MKFDFLLSVKKFETVSIVKVSKDLPNLSILSIIDGGTVIIWQPISFDWVKLYGSLTLAHKISTFLYLLANFMLLTNSGIGSLPTSPALPAKIEIITFVFLFILFKIFLVWIAV